MTSLILGSRGVPALAQSRPSHTGLGVYAVLARRLPISYRNKIMLIAFLGTHVPLLVLIAWYATSAAPNAAEAFRVIGLALAATLVGTGVTLVILNQLLRPILMTAQALRLYTAHRRLPELPVGFLDEAGTLMTDTVSTIIRLDAVLEALAYIDRVTGLPNRERMLRQLADRLTTGKSLALCVVALRNIDSITAGFGDVGANIVLRFLTTRLVAAAGYGAIVARLEGPRFAFVVETGAGLSPLPARLEAVLALLRPDIIDGDMAIAPDLGLGVALAPEHAVGAEALLNAAQSAVPTEIQAPPVFYSAKAQAAARHKLDLEIELRHALERNEFSLHFQPIVRVSRTDELVEVLGAEALLRWEHPEHGMIPPGIFIPVAERCGMMDAIGLWVLRTGCRQLRLWDEAELPPVRLAINLSAGQFGDRRLAQIIEDALSRQAMPAHRLEIEMTETAAMQDRDTTLRIFGELHELGTTVAIDDFGTGYSTMSHLRDLRFDTLKIDREFVRNVDTSRSGLAICKALIELASGLDIAVLAEGVETAAEVAQLRSHDCRVFQGYHFGKPMPSEAFAAALRGGLTPLSEASPPEAGDHHKSPNHEKRSLSLFRDCAPNRA